MWERLQRADSLLLCAVRHPVVDDEEAPKELVLEELA